METIRKTIYDIDLAKQLQRIFSGVLLAKNDKQANRMGVNVFQDGQAVNLSGYTVKGYFIRSGVETLILTGAIDGNTAYVDLEAKCYHKDGSFSISIVLCHDGKEQTLVIFDGRIACTCTDTIIENENTLSLADLVQQEWVTNVLTAADTATEQAGKAAESAAQAQAIKDSIPPDYTALVETVNQKAPAIFVDASGAIVTITDGAEGMPVQSLVTHVEPVQEGSGDPSLDNVRPIIGWDAVSVTGAGKNLFGGEALADRFQEVVSVTRDDEARTIAFRASNMSGKVFFTDFKPETQYTIILYGINSGATNITNLSILYTDGTSGKPVFKTAGENSFAVYTTTAGKSVESLRGAYNDGTTTLYYDQCGIFEGVLTDADFITYQGKTLTAELPETLCGFVNDWTTGLATVTHDRIVATGDEWYSLYEFNGKKGIMIYNQLKQKSMRADGVCTHAPVTVDMSGGLQVWYGVGDNEIYVAGLIDALGVSTLEDAVAWIKSQYAAGTPVTFVYKLDEPYTIQLTPQQLSTLKGTNNIWSSAGETEVTYAADTKMYADAKDSTAMIGTAEPGMVATKNYASGDFIVVGKSLYKATAAIATGEAITPGTNCTATTVIEQLAAIYNLIK